MSNVIKIGWFMLAHLCTNFSEREKKKSNKTKCLFHRKEIWRSISAFFYSHMNFVIVIFLSSNDNFKIGRNLKAFDWYLSVHLPLLLHSSSWSTRLCLQSSDLEKFKFSPKASLILWSTKRRLFVKQYLIPLSFHFFLVALSLVVKGANVIPFLIRAFKSFKTQFACSLPFCSPVTHYTSCIVS